MDFERLALIKRICLLYHEQGMEKTATDVCQFVAELMRLGVPTVDEAFDIVLEDALEVESDLGDGD